MRNMMIATESSSTDSATEAQAVSSMSLISLALETLRPTGAPASRENASCPSAVVLAGVGKRSNKAKNQSDRLLPAKRSISGKYTGRYSR